LFLLLLVGKQLLLWWLVHLRNPLLQLVRSQCQVRKLLRLSLQEISPAILHLPLLPRLLLSLLQRLSAVTRKLRLRQNQMASFLSSPLLITQLGRKEPTPVVATTPLAGSWAHAATSGQRIASAASAVNSPQPNTTPKQSALTPATAPPVENLPQAAQASQSFSNDKAKDTSTSAASHNTAASKPAETAPTKSNSVAPEPSPPLSAKPMPSPVLSAKNNSEPLPTAPAAASDDLSKQPTKGLANKVTPTPQNQPLPQPQSIPQQPQQQLPSHVMSSPGHAATQQQQQGLPPPHRPAAAVPSSSLGSGSQELQALAHMLKMSMTHIPPTDVSNDRSKPYAPRNPYPGQLPSSFPTTPHPIIENSALFERLPMDSLFLSFYYQQGSYQQYLAAKQLKKHSWRFHKKYMTWFQRHEEPKTTTNDYEEGTYVYFDYESGKFLFLSPLLFVYLFVCMPCSLSPSSLGWCQRIKSEFKFEYAYLEDELTQAASHNPSTQPPPSASSNS
jgi:CCR4-NOT transcription complex subunit 3